LGVDLDVDLDLVVDLDVVVNLDGDDDVDLDARVDDCSCETLLLRNGTSPGSGSSQRWSRC